MKGKKTEKPTYKELQRSNRLHIQALNDMSVELKKAKDLRVLITTEIPKVSINLGSEAVANNLKDALLRVIRDASGKWSAKDEIMDFLRVVEKHILSFQFDNLVKPTQVRFEIAPPIAPSTLMSGDVSFMDFPLPSVTLEGEIVSSHRSIFLGMPMVIVKCGERLYEVEMGQCTVIS